MSSHKPTNPLPILPDKIPNELRGLKRWVGWKYEPKPGKPSERTKVPYNAVTGRKADKTNPADWHPFDLALHGATSGVYSGVGFCLGPQSEESGVVAFDLDRATDPETGELLPSARKIVDRLPCYWEKSPSGNGLRGWMLGSLPWKRHRRTLEDGVGLEVYEADAYLTVTGQQLDGTLCTLEDLTSAIADLYAEYFPKKPEATHHGNSHENEGPPSGGSPLTDDEVLALARGASNGVKFRQLWDGAVDGEDKSGGDLGLCNLLAFYTGVDEAQIDRLFRRSARMRPKWNERRGERTYGQLTIETALADRTEFYRGNGNSAHADPIAGCEPDGHTGVTADEPSTPRDKFSVPALGHAAYHGPLGDIVRACDGKTEAHPAALLITLLAGYGNLIGRLPYKMVGDDRHYLNFFAGIVGPTAQGAKGTSAATVRRILGRVDGAWEQDCILSSLASGEGLIARVADPKPVIDKKTGLVKYTPQPPDRRLFFLENEFGRLLVAKNRDGSSLGPVLQDAWDGRLLQVNTKLDALKATGAYVSGCVHITAKELSTKLSDVDKANGFANRFLWIAAKRVASIPHPKAFDLAHPAVIRLQDAAAWIRQQGQAFGGLDGLELQWTPAGYQMWNDVYEGLRSPAEQVELLGRLAPQVIRLASLYAAIDQQIAIDQPHLDAALAWREYAQMSASWIFRSETGDAIADKVLDYLRENGGKATRTDLYNKVFHHKIGTPDLDAARDILLEKNLMSVEKGPAKPTGGITPEFWVLR